MDKVHNIEDLENLNFNDLRKVAKERGIKTNKKTGKNLIDAIRKECQNEGKLLSPLVAKYQDTSMAGQSSSSSKTEPEHVEKKELDTPQPESSSRMSRRLTKNKACLESLNESVRLSGEFGDLLKKRKRTRASMSVNNSLIATPAPLNENTEDKSSEGEIFFKTPCAPHNTTPAMDSTFVPSEDDEASSKKKHMKRKFEDTPHHTVDTGDRKNRSVKFASSAVVIQSPFLRSRVKNPQTLRPTPSIIKPGTSSSKKLPASVQKSGGSKSSGLPRRQGVRPGTTPDFKKIHEKAFNQMDSLDIYAAKKSKRAQELLAAPQPVVKKPAAAMNLGQKFKFSPAPFKPTVFNTKEANFNFMNKESGFVFQAKAVLPNKENGPASKEPTKVVQSSKRHLSKTKYGPVKSKIPQRGATTRSQTSPVKPSLFTARNVNVNFMKKDEAKEKLAAPRRLNAARALQQSYNDQNINTKHIALGQKLHTATSETITARQRIAIKGVRLNKRFELQMRFRQEATAGSSKQ